LHAPPAGGSPTWLFDMMRSLLAAAILLWASSTAVAQQEDVTSGNVFLPACKSFLIAHIDPSPKALDAFYMGECVGIVATVSILAESVGSCPPMNSTAAQQVRVVVSFLEAHSERLHENFIDLAIDAFRQAWPCAR
jgi:F0F1-type ATP synthase assembly protein I